MELVILDGRRMTTPEETHKYLAGALHFPGYYGGNLDALADCLSELGGGVRVILVNPSDMREALGEYAGRLVSVFEEISASPASFGWSVCEG